MNIARFLKHTTVPGWILRRPFPKSLRQTITDAIRASEARHRAQLVFVIEDALEPHELWRGLTGAERARDVFAEQRVWDTAENCGVLVYLLLADRDVEIVADRGVHARVGAPAWESVCRTMETAFRAGRFEDGALAGIAAITDLLAREYPRTATTPDDNLPDQVITLR